jgi:hypothetical protein
VKLNIHNNRLKITFSATEKILSLKDSFAIPLEHIAAITTAAPRTGWSDVRAPGTYLPGIIKAGTYYTRRGKEFWYVRRKKGYLILELKNEPYKRVILSIERNNYWADIIRNAVR